MSGPTAARPSRVRRAVDGLPRSVEPLARLAVLDRMSGAAARQVRRLPRSTRDALQGVWLGMPLHPILTDVTIGAWTAGFIVDVVGGRQGRPTSRRLVGLGVLHAVPTALAGATDWAELDDESRRVGFVHAVVVLSATGLYALSYRERARGRHGRGVAWGLAGATVATVGAHFGGALVFGRGAGVRRPAGGDAHPVVGAQAVIEDELRHVEIGETDVLLANVGGRLRALSDRCSHLGALLSEGARVDDCVRCPWHGSEFRLDDGSVVHGPATAPLAVFAISHDPATPGREVRRVR